MHDNYLSIKNFINFKIYAFLFKENKSAANLDYQQIKISLKIWCGINFFKYW